MTGAGDAGRAPAGTGAVGGAAGAEVGDGDGVEGMRTP